MSNNVIVKSEPEPVDDLVFPVGFGKVVAAMICRSMTPIIGKEYVLADGSRVVCNRVYNDTRRVNVSNVGERGPIHWSREVGFDDLESETEKMSIYNLARYLEDSVMIIDEEQRLGQRMFNGLHAAFPEIAEAIRGTEYDPFQLDERIPAFLKRVLDFVEV